jgi:hypothetical protein
MSAPKNATRASTPANTIKRRTSRARAIAAVPATPAIILSAIEMRIVLAHRNMSAETGDAMLDLAESFAGIGHKARKAPPLRLIVGGAA